ncbi:DinB family protein [Microbacteriaceae bacterium 4G12]
MFLYNWQVRDDWFTWCETLSVEELRKERVGGMGSILNNLFHIIDCEQLWVHQMQNKPVMTTDMSSISNLDDVKAFSNLTRPIIEDFLQSWTPDCEQKILEITNKNGVTYSFTYGKIVRHIISHEIHHIGQLSIWARELAIKPVSSDLIIREYA